MQARNGETPPRVAPKGSRDNVGECPPRRSGVQLKLKGKFVEITTQHSDNVTTIWCKGRIVLGDDLHRLKVADCPRTRLK